jgi:RecA-family ATPase
VSRLWPLYSVDELGQLPEPKWLVEDHITDGLTVLYGPPGTGKTFLALSWALAISTGRQWFGHDVLHAPALYVSGEGGGGLARRISAWQSDTQTFGPRLYLVIGTVQLTHRDHVVALRDDIHATGAKLIVVDTLARAMAGADENSSTDMGLLIQGLDWIRRDTGCAALVVHHSGVERTRPRGSSALFGAADTLIRVDGKDNTLDVTCEKQKEAAPFRRLSFALKQRVGSCVLGRLEPGRAHMAPGGF